MDAGHITLPIGQLVPLPGHFDLPVTLESARPLGKGFECRVRLHDGSLDEAIISEEEAAALAGTTPAAAKATLANAEQIRLLVESARIRLAYAHDHKCSAYTKKSSMRGDEAEKTKRYQLAEHLTAQPAGHVLLLTATPHHGDDDRFAHFILHELELLPPAQRARRLAQIQGRAVDDVEQDEDDLDEAERDQLSDEFTSAIELDQLRAEIAALQELSGRAHRVREQAESSQGGDSKLAALKECLARAEFSELKDGRGNQFAARCDNLVRRRKWEHRLLQARPISVRNGACHVSSPCYTAGILPTAELRHPFETSQRDH